METGDPLLGLAGNGPVVIEKDSGRITHLGSACVLFPGQLGNVAEGVGKLQKNSTLCSNVRPTGKTGVVQIIVSPLIAGPPLAAIEVKLPA